MLSLKILRPPRQRSRQSASPMLDKCNGNEHSSRRRPSSLFDQLQRLALIFYSRPRRTNKSLALEVKRRRLVEKSDLIKQASR
ncbi:hypothetical protein T01_6274 [Trichinella spiralis]|uniref:Uncharacterized protein n=1 Tax=Trichinella spiralis TaxID=6334 RepID=A0A0V1C052_TRISP|nr:hypothetical protein T01_6274 [Trichinella spiralis]